MKRFRLHAPLFVSVLIVAALALTGCASSSSKDGGAIAPSMSGVSSPMAPAVDEQSAREMAGSGGMVDGAKIIKNADVTLWVEDVESTADAVADVAAKYEGFVSSSQLGNNGYVPYPYASGGTASEIDSGWMQIRVPADKLEAALADISGLGDVRSTSTSAGDVTTQYVDMAARLDNFKASEARMRELLAQSETVADTIAIESELSRLRSEIDSLEGQLRYLDEQVDMSGISVNISKVPSPGSVFDNFSLSELFTNALRGALKVVEWIITVAVALVPVALVVWIVVLIVRAIRRGRVS